MPLGFKIWNDFQIDFTNKDEIASFKQLNGLYGMYQPDTITSYQWQGVTFVLTANEGDSRDYDGYSEEVRVKTSSIQTKLTNFYQLNYKPFMMLVAEQMV